MGYRLMIVDDEYWVRKRLLNTIDWQAIGICEVYGAEDGNNALSMAIEYEPDIVVTDINMPGLSGIELMEALDVSALCPRFILISGFNEFEYARSAIKLGVADYLLKPIDETELINTVKKILSDFENQKKEKERLDALIHYSDSIRKRVLGDLLAGKIDRPDNSILRLRDFLKIDFPFTSSLCLIVHSGPILTADKNDYVEQTLVDFSISNILEYILPQYLEHSILLSIDDLNTALLFCGEEDNLKKTAEEIVAEVGRQIKELFNLSITFGIGEEVADLPDLCKSYKTAKYAINACNFNGISAIFNYGKKNAGDFPDMQSVYFEYNLKSIATDIKNCNKDAAAKGLKQLLDEFLKQNNQSPSPLQIKLFYINVMNTLLKECLVSDPPSEEFLNVCIDSLEDVGTFFTPEKLMCGLENIVGFLLTQYNEFIGNKRHWLIDQIIDYIQKNYASPLTLKSVTGKFYLSSCYFCKLFKNETGLTFTHYLMKLRIEKAKEIMMSNQKLYDIAAAVGYDNVQYFSTIFKEIEGISPSQYRAAQIKSTVIR